MKINYIILFISISMFSTRIVAWKKNTSITRKTITQLKLSHNNNKNNNNKNEQCIITSKNNNVYCNSEAELYIKQNDFLTNKKLITISPGGFKGFYLLGVLTFIKENYNLDNFIFSGASAGSWNSLFMCYKGEPLDFVYNLLDYNIKKATTINELQYFMKYKILSTYKESNFDLQRLFIGVTTFNKFKPITNIYSDFSDLDDAINCCMASSHIPLITGGITNRYHNMYSFDGGFSSYPYLHKENSVLHVSHTMWAEIKNKDKNKRRSVKGLIQSIKHFTEFFSISKNNLLELFDNGYNDAKKNKKYLDEVFIERKEEKQEQEQQQVTDKEESNIEF